MVLIPTVSMFLLRLREANCLNILCLLKLVMKSILYVKMY